MSVRPSMTMHRRLYRQMEFLQTRYGSLLTNAVQELRLSAIKASIMRGNKWTSYASHKFDMTNFHKSRTSDPQSYRSNLRKAMNLIIWPKDTVNARYGRYPPKCLGSSDSSTVMRLKQFVYGHNCSSVYFNVFQRFC